MPQKVLTVDEYVAMAPDGVRPALEAPRAAVREAVPEAEEYIGWGVASYAMGHGWR